MTPETARRLSLAAGPIAFGLIRVAEPGGLSGPANSVLGIALWMGIWWISECLPLAVTALLPIALFPLLGVATIKVASSHFANEVVYLYLGGFLLAAALEHWQGHRRLALNVLVRVGTDSRRIVLGVMAVTFFISMWISNTATAAMMYPIALAIGQMFGDDDAAHGAKIALLLGVAYAASIGGMATLIGTPPNLVLAGAVKQMLGRELGFVEFLKYGLPTALILLPLCWAMLVFVMHPKRTSLAAAGFDGLRDQLQALGPMRGGERRILLLFVTVALSWFFREPKEMGGVTIPGLATVLPGITDAGIAVIGAIFLFIIPAADSLGIRRPLLTWREARAIPWDVLLLFGGGLSLAAAMESSGLADQLGKSMGAMQGLPLPIVLLGLATATLILSELASNLAVASMGMPIAMSLATALGQDPLLIMLVIGLAASTGFALPMATPPNAIVFGSGELKIRDMVRAGLLLDVVAVLVVVGVLLAVY